MDSEQVDSLQVQLQLLVHSCMRSMCRHMRALKWRAALHHRLAVLLERRSCRALQRFLDANLVLRSLFPRLLLPRHLVMCMQLCIMFLVLICCVSVLRSRVKGYENQMQAIQEHLPLSFGYYRACGVPHPSAKETQKNPQSYTSNDIESSTRLVMRMGQ